MLSGINYIPILSKQDVYNFCLAARYLHLSKDVAKYIAKHFFYNWVLLSDKLYYRGNVPSKEPKNAYERIKREMLVVVDNPGPVRLAEIAYAYARAGKRVLYLHQIDMIGGLKLLGHTISNYSGSMSFNNGGCIIPHYGKEIETDLLISVYGEYDQDKFVSSWVRLMVKFK